MKFSKLSASAEYNMFILKGNQCMDGRWSISHTYLGGGAGGVKCFFKKFHVLLSMHLHVPRWPVCLLQYAVVIKSTCPSSPAACTDVRATKVHKCQSHWGPLGARLLTDPLLRLTSGSTLLPWHFVGPNSNFLCGLLDWNTKLKVSRKDSSVSHCAGYLLPAIWGIHFVIITQTDQFIIVSIRD